MKRFIILLVILLAASVAFAQIDEETSWRQVVPDSFIDSDGIVGAEDIYGFTFLLKTYNKGQYEPVNGKKIQYTLSQYTLDCGKKSYKIGVIDSYGYNDNFVSGDYNKYATFQPIVAGTAIAELYKQLCRP